MTHCEHCDYYYCADYPPDSARHRHRHDIWQYGPKVLAEPNRLWPNGDIVIVDAWTSPAALCRLAYDVACVVQREKGWDFSSFPHPFGRRRRGTRANLDAVMKNHLRCGLDDYPRAYLYRRDNRVVGYWVVWPKISKTRVSLSTDTYTEIAQTVTRSCGPIWTHREHRRTGIATALYRSVVADTASPIASTPIAVDAPISDDAYGFFTHITDEWPIT